ncbi:MAG: class D beta-lactamase [Bacteroidota bacterium]|nr:class D beta-lactamase [Bacteroidota bacterium]
MKRLLTASLILLAIAFGSCTVNNAETDSSLKQYFDSAHVEGCFALLDNITGKVTVYNMKVDTQRITPGSSFEIVNAMIGLESNKILDEKMVVKWDGVQRPDTQWNKDLDMKQAFSLGAVPYFQEVARRVGRDTMKYWIDTLHYGNMDLSGPIDSFWLNNTLKVSPDEQLGLMEKLYFDQLPFERRTQDIVSEAMLKEDNTLYKFSYHAGWGTDPASNPIGWLQGWIVENRHVYFFVTLAKSADKGVDMKTIPLKITREILTHMGFFKGEK